MRLVLKKIFIVTGYTDLRSGIDRLADTVRSYLGEDAIEPDTLYLFCGRKTEYVFEGNTHPAVPRTTGAGCWAHARRRYEETVKALPAKSRKSNIVWQALEQIRMIYHVDNTLKELTPEERKERRQESVKPLVEAYFVWVKEKKKEGRIAEKSKT